MQFIKINPDEKKIVAIIICNPADPLTGNTAFKYSHVHNTESGLQKFKNFAKKFHTAKYINFYSKETGLYLGREYL